MSPPEAAKGKVVLVGGGGHAKVIVEVLRAARPELELAGVLDKTRSVGEVLGAPVVGDDDALPALRASGVAYAFIAIGDNRLRERLAEKARAAGFALINAISPAAVVSPSARLGEGVAVMAGAVINAGSQIADLAIVNTGAVIDHDCKIGQAAHVAPGCALAGGVTVGPRAFLGVGVSAIPGVQIGADTQVGAGACVTDDLAPGVLALGVPARPVRSLAPGVPDER